MGKFESDLDKALRSLKNQGLIVETGGIAVDGIVFQVNGFLLTSNQILALQEQDNLHLHGIKEFDLKEKEVVQKDIEAARRRIRFEEFKEWTAKQICDYINHEFSRKHSIGQITGVLNRLGVEYKKS
jgi:hypothetical protein